MLLKGTFDLLHIGHVNRLRATSYFSNYPTRELFDALFGFMADRGLKPIYNEEYMFDDLPAALARQDTGAGGKIVIVHG